MPSKRPPRPPRARALAVPATSASAGGAGSGTTGSQRPPSRAPSPATPERHRFGREDPVERESTAGTGGGGGFAGRGSKEDDMSDTTPALDEAFERMAAASFELPNGFVNHGAMACEALAVLDCTDDIDSWARRFARAGGTSVDPVVPAGPGPGVGTGAPVKLTEDQRA